MNENAYMVPVSKELARNEYGLTPRAQRFVREYVYNCPNNGAECARRAGYSAARADRAAYELLNSKSVQAAIRREQEKLLAENGPLAFQCMKDLMMTSDKDEIRFKAAKDILDRGGWKAVQKIVVEHTVMSPEERRARIMELQKEFQPQVIDITPGVDDGAGPV
jgi:phage terminase small subunit